MSTSLGLPAGADKYGAWYDEATAAQACAFFPRFLRHTEAEWAGEPFYLADWQARIVRHVFGWKRDDGTRLVRVVYVETPRKNGKTEFGAGLALLMLLADGEYGGQGYSMAVDRDQAKITFNKMVTMVGLSSELRKHLELYKTSIYCPALNGSFRALSSSPKSKHGFSPTFALGDELHEWATGELADVVHKGMAARRQPLEVYLTTAGVYGQGFGWEMHQYAERVRDGIVEDPTFLAVIYGADAEADWTDPAVWAEVNPGLGVSPKLEFLEAECARAQESARLENEFRRYHLNQWTEQVVRWLDLAAWDACAAPVDPEALIGRPCFAGLDLSATTDLTALVLVFPDDDGGYDVLPYFFCPKESVERRARRDRVPYPEWVRDGHLIATEGATVDYQAVLKTIEILAARYEIRRVALDDWNSTMLYNAISELGLEAALVRLGWKSYNTPTKELERLVIDHELRHGGHPVMRWNAANVSVATDPAGNLKPAKDKSSDRIDGIIGLILGLGQALTSDPDRPSLNDVVLARGGLA
ncbi:MAG: terminase large subunit [Alphaproteobacteria bacterium]|nr:terminase large subunit [Alphaproteobacteria bacterium]